MNTMEKLKAIAFAVKELPISDATPEVVLGISSNDAMAILAEVGAPMRKHFYDDKDCQVIESRSIEIDGVRFSAQADGRMMAEGEAEEQMVGLPTA